MPHTPRHPWNLDFPHTMLRAKAIKLKNGEVGAGEKLLASTETHGQFAGIPDHERVYAIADEDLDRENEEKTSAAHFVRFEFAKAIREAVRAGAIVKLGFDHTNYPAHTGSRPKRWRAWRVICDRAGTLPSGSTSRPRAGVFLSGA